MKLELRNQYQSIEKPEDGVKIFLFPTKKEVHMYKIVFSSIPSTWAVDIKKLAKRLAYDYSGLVDVTYRRVNEASIRERYVPIHVSPDQLWNHIEVVLNTITNTRFDTLSASGLAIRVTKERLSILIAVTKVLPHIPDLEGFVSDMYTHFEKALDIITKEQL